MIADGFVEVRWVTRLFSFPTSSDPGAQAPSAEFRPLSPGRENYASTNHLPFQCSNLSREGLSLASLAPWGPGAGRKVERRMLNGSSWSDDYKQPSDWSGLHAVLILTEVAGYLLQRVPASPACLVNCKLVRKRPCLKKQGGSFLMNVTEG